MQDGHRRRRAQVEVQGLPRIRVLVAPHTGLWLRLEGWARASDSDGEAEPCGSRAALAKLYLMEIGGPAKTQMPMASTRGARPSSSPLSLLRRRPNREYYCSTTGPVYEHLPTKP